MEDVMQKLSIQVKGRKIPVWVDSCGYFNAQQQGNQYHEETLTQLKLAIEKDLAKTPLNIPFIRINTSYDKDNQPVLAIERGVIRGVHNANRNLLIHWEGQTERRQLSHYERRNLLRGDVDVKELRRLWLAHRQAEAAYTDFREKHTLADLPDA